MTAAGYTTESIGVEGFSLVSMTIDIPAVSSKLFLSVSEVTRPPAMAAKMDGLLRFSLFQRMLGIGGIQSRLNHCRYFLCSRNKFIQSLSSSAYLERNHPGGRLSIRGMPGLSSGWIVANQVTLFRSLNMYFYFPASPPVIRRRETNMGRLCSKS